MGKKRQDSSSDSDSSDSSSSSDSSDDSRKKKVSSKSKHKKHTSDSDSERNSKKSRKKVEKARKGKKQESDDESSEKIREKAKQHTAKTGGESSAKACIKAERSDKVKEESVLLLQDHSTHDHSTHDSAPKKGRRRNLRREKTAMESDEDNDVVKSTLAEAKLLQKARRRGMGVCWTAEDQEELEKEEQELKSVLTGSASGGLVSANAMAFRSKAEETERAQSAKDQFVLEQLDKIRMGDKQYAKRVEEEKEKSKPKSSPEDELYAVPEFLRAEKEEVEESGDRWLTGIAEVPLPMSVKLANIERTEKAKHDIFIKRQEERGSFRPSAEGGNLSTNFKKNRSDWIQQRKDESEKYLAAIARKEEKEGTTEESESRRKPVPLPRHMEYASDDRVVDRFVKRYRYK